MAKTIKSIICPQCGSNKIKELEKDYFQCNSCDTNFFLDTDDITITHKHVYEGGQVSPVGDKGKVTKTMVLSIIAVVFIVLVLSIFPSKKARKSANGDTALALKEQVKNKRFSPKTFGKGIVELSKDKMAFVTLTYFDELKSGEQTDVLYLYVIDAKSAKELNRVEQVVDLTKKGAGVSKNWVEIESFLDADNNLYFIVNKYFIYLFDKQSLQLKDVTSTYFKGYNVFESGVASVSVSYRNFEYLLVINNKGLKYAFVPSIKTVVPEQEWATLPELKLPNPEVKRCYRFTTKSELTTLKEEPVQLIQFEQKMQKGYPFYERYYVTNKDYLVGEFKNRGEYGADVVKNYSEKSDRIVSFKDFTPKRFYQEGAQVLAEDKEGVVVAVKTTKNESEPYTIQKLRHVDGGIIWTVKTNWIDGILKLNQVEDNYFALMNNKTNVVVMNMKGEQVAAIVMEFKVD